MGSAPVHSQSSSLREQNTFQGVSPSKFKQILDFHEKVQREGQGINIKVATFNYGHCDSPFQYYSQNDQQNIQQLLFQKLSKLFSYLLDKQMSDPNYFCFEQIKPFKSLNQTEKEQVGNLIKMYDRRYRMNRYSPLYYPNVGIQKSLYLTEKKQFCQVWKKCFKESLRKQLFFLDNYTSWELTQNDRQAFEYLCRFDWVCFMIIVLYSYSNLETINKWSSKQAEAQFYRILEKQNNHIYQKVMIEEFSKKVIDEDHKIRKLLDFLDDQNLDILFIQNASKFLVKQIQKKTNRFRVAFSEKTKIKTIILISWECLAKLQPHEEIKPLQFYNRIHIPNVLILKKSKKDNSGSFRATRHGQFVERKRYLMQPSEINDPSPKAMKHTISMTQGQQTQKQNPENRQQIIIGGVQSHNSENSQQQNSSDEEYERRKYTLEQRDKERLLKTVLKQVMKSKMSNDLFQALDRFQGAFIQFFDRLILISWECESNVKIAFAEEALKKLQEEFKEYHIIMGCSVKESIKDLYNFQMNVFPGENNQMNNEYKRETFLKVDSFLFGNSAFPQRGNRDINTHIFSTMQFENSRLLNIEGTQIDFNDEVLIPSEIHPYEEFLVEAEFQYYCFRTHSSHKKELHLTYSSLQQTIT